MQPNILWYCTDQQRFDTIGALGNPYVITPTLDRLAHNAYQIPIEVTPTRATSLAMRWLHGYAKARPGKSMMERLANEIIDAANERGESVKKREDTHRMAEANKAFSHYRW